MLCLRIQIQVSSILKINFVKKVVCAHTHASYAPSLLCAFKATGTHRKKNVLFFDDIFLRKKSALL